MNLLKTFVRKWREAGLAYTLLHGFSSVAPGKFIAFGSFVVTGKVISPSNGTEYHDCRFIALENRQPLREAGYTDHQLEDRFGRGAMAAVLERDGRIVACAWYSSTGHSDEYWIHFATGGGDIWMWDVWVAPELRGQGLIATLLSFGEHELAARGYSRIINTIDRLNRNSRRAFAKAQYETLVEVSYCRVVSRTRVRIGDRVHQGRFTGKSRITITVPE